MDRGWVKKLNIFEYIFIILAFILLGFFMFALYFLKIFEFMGQKWTKTRYRKI